MPSTACYPMDSSTRFLLSRRANPQCSYMLSQRKPHECSSWTEQMSARTQ
jgi:hypothetical protein